MKRGQLLVVALCLAILLYLASDAEAIVKKIVLKKFGKKLVKASLLGKAFGGTKKVIVPLIIPIPFKKPSFSMGWSPFGGGLGGGFGGGFGGGHGGGFGGDFGAEGWW